MQKPTWEPRFYQSSPSQVCSSHIKGTSQGSALKNDSFCRLTYKTLLKVGKNTETMS